MRVKLFTSLLTASLLLTGIQLPSWAERLTVPGGTPVTLKLTDKIGSATQKKGDIVSFTVNNDVFIGGKKVIAAGTSVQGTVEDASKRFFAGIGGYLKLSVQSVPSVKGTPIAVKFDKQSSGDSSLLGVILGVVCCCVFFFIPGKDVEVQAGTLYNAVTLGPVEVEI